MLRVVTITTTWAQQCTQPSQIFLPTPDTARNEGFGEYIDVHNDYMVVGVPFSDSLQRNSGIAYVYKINTSNKWVKVADLAPSDPAKYNSFGYQVSISENSIAIFSRQFNDDGNAQAKIYIFEKPTSGTWISTTESYVIRNVTPKENGTFGAFSLQGDELLAIAGIESKIGIQIYKKQNGIFSLTQFIDISNFAGFNSWELTTTDGYFAISSNQFLNSDRSQGVVFVFEREAAGYKTTPIALRSSEQGPNVWQAFGTKILAENSTLFVSGLNQVNSQYNQIIYVFERPLGGWVEDRKPFMFQLSGYIFNQYELAASANYLICPTSDRKIAVFKKPVSGWSSAATMSQLEDLTAEKNMIGSQVALAGNHLVVGCPATYLQAGFSDDWIADYYSPQGEWNTSGLRHQQKIKKISINAGLDFFGYAISARGNFLAVAAGQDDALGQDAGAVYTYDITKKSSEPVQKIFPPEQQNYTGFGTSVVLGDSLLFISAPYTDSIRTTGLPPIYNMGKVYVYRFINGRWKYRSQIKAPTIQTEMQFGMTVAWSKGYVAVTEFYTGSSESMGSVHIFKETQGDRYAYIATVQPSTRQRADFFGKSIIMTDSMMVIGTGNRAVNSSYRTRVFLYRKRGEWKNAVEDGSLSASDTGWSDRFGASVAMSGEYIVVGSYYHPGFDPRPIPRSYVIPGAAYVFKRPPGGWLGSITEIAKLSPSDPVEFGSFGYSVAIDHDDIFVGSPYAIDLYNRVDYLTNNDNSLRHGKVYHFVKPTGEWVTTNRENRQFTSFEPELLDGYGFRLLVSDRFLYTSSLLDDTKVGFSSGSVQTVMQLPVITPLRTLCSDETPVRLQAFPERGGVWSGSGVNPINKMFSPAIAGPGQHTITYTVSGCQATTTVNVNSSDFRILSASDLIQTKCIGKTASIFFSTTESSSNYRWYYKEKPSDAPKKIDSLKYQIATNRPGTYQVSVRRGACPSIKQEFVVNEEPPVFIRIAPVAPICDDLKVNLIAVPNSGFWSGTSVSRSGVFDPTPIPDGVYKQRFQLTTSLGCVWKDSINVTVDKLKQPNLKSQFEKICGSDPVVLQLTSIDDRSVLVWFDDFGKKMGMSSSLSVSSPGRYFASVSKHSCSFDTPIAEVVEQADSLFVPNVFTPNGDLANDVFQVRGDALKDFRIVVLNRYGTAVFQTSDPAFKWDGGNVSPGVYYWRVDYVNCAGLPRERKGWVQVVR